MLTNILQIDSKILYKYYVIYCQPVLRQNISTNVTLNNVIKYSIKYYQQILPCQQILREILSINRMLNNVIKC